MEEDVEIELLYKAHGQVLMEAAAKNEDGKSRVCEFNESNREQGISTERAVDDVLPSKKYSCTKSKRRPRAKLRAKKKCEPKPNKKEKIALNDTSSDVEDLIDSSIVSLVMANRADSDLESDCEINTCFEGNNKSENCINEILDDEFIFKEPNPELGGTLVENNARRCPVEKSLLELQSLQSMISKRDDVINMIERKLKEELIDNEGKLNHVREELYAVSHKVSSKLKEPSFTRCYFKKFGMPYFHDSSGFPAPPNNDVKKKLKNGELIVTSIPKLKYWRKVHKDKLQDAIQLTLVKERSDKLVKEIDKLKSKLVNVPDEQTEKDILDRIVECQKQLKRTKSMSYLDLLASENPDREYDWLKYSASDLNLVHSAEECKTFWNLYLKPTVNKSRWETSEDEKLKQVVEEMNFQDWKSIAQKLGTNRTAYQCFIHYRNRFCDKRDFSFGKWTKEEDEKLLSVINSAKVGDFIPWTKVASYMGDRNHNQIYNRYVNSLDPKLVKGRFSKEEDLLIVSGIEVFGVTYKELASLMSNRTTCQIRERYERHLIPKTAKTGTFSLEEDEQLLKLVEKHGERNFSIVAEKMKTRSRTQVRQRYNCMMEMMRAKPGWTPASHVRRRNIHNLSKNLTETQKKVEKLRREIDHVEKTFKLTKLESDAFKIEKLKELRDELFMKKLNLTKYKKKTSSENSEINNKLLEYFKYQHLSQSVKSSIRQNSLDTVAYLNEILLLAKYFGHDLQLPKYEDEIQKNNRLSHSLKTFLIETLKEDAVGATCDKENAVESSSLVREPQNIDYVELEVDDTLIMEERWHNVTKNLSDLNFSEFFKRTVFDYSNGMHKDIWDSKVRRSEVTVTNTSDANNHRTCDDQMFFFPPNSLTTIGYKSILLSRTRLKRDAKKLFEEQVKYEDPKMIHQLEDKFQETLLTLFYCPKVLSLTDIGTTLLPPARSRISSSENLTNHNSIFNLLNNSNQNTSGVVRKAALPVKNKALQAKKIKRNILEHNKNYQRQLKEFKIGITYKRKMSIEHLVKNIKEPKSTFLSVPSTTSKNLVQRKKENNAGVKANKLNDGSYNLRTSKSQNMNGNPNNTLTVEDCYSLPILKVPTNTYSRTRRVSKRHLDSDKCAEPPSKKSISTNSRSTRPTRLLSHESDQLCFKSH